MSSSRFHKLIRILITSQYRKTFMQYGVAASTENDDFLFSLRNNGIKCVIDIGANQGQFALSARHQFHEANIISFEPLKEPAKIFHRVFNTDSLTVLYEVAIGPEEKESIIHVSRSNDSSSLLPISSLQSNLFPGTSEKEIRSVQVKPLNAILDAKDIQQPALLKIDVQGYEREVLEGCKLLLPFISFIYVECSFMELYSGQSLAHQVIAWLLKRSFILTGIYNVCYAPDGRAIQADFLFTYYKDIK